jgi:hypothetical protein
VSSCTYCLAFMSLLHSFPLRFSTLHTCTHTHTYKHAPPLVFTPPLTLISLSFSIPSSPLFSSLLLYALLPSSSFLLIIASFVSSLILSYQMEHRAGVPGSTILARFSPPAQIRSDTSDAQPPTPQHTHAQTHS